MTQMEKEMMELAKKHLPEQVCGELKKQLEELGTLRDEVRTLTTKNTRLTKERDKLQELKFDAGQIARDKEENAAAFAKLKKDEADFERNKKVYELEQQLSAQKTISANAMEINGSLTRNTEYRKSAFGNAPVAVPGHTDNNGYSTHPEVRHVCTNTDETTKAE